MKKNYTLKRELTFLMILTAVCTLLSVCAAVFYVFFSFIFQKHIYYSMELFSDRNIVERQLPFVT